MQISVVIPLFNEAESLPELMQWIDRVMQTHNYSYEVIMVDDGSKDNSWQNIQSLRTTYPSLKGIKFQRNYGKSAALNEGFKMAKGDIVVTMDADLQDSPDEIPELYRMVMQEDLDVVSGWKKVRHDPLSKTIPTKLYNWAARRITGIYLHDFNCGLKAYKNEVIKMVKVRGEMHRYIPVLAKNKGFLNIGEKIVQHQARKYGETKFGMSRFINGFLDLITISFLSKFGKRPMHFFGLWGTLMFIFGLFSAGYLGVTKLYKLSQGMKAILITDNPWFYIAMVGMILGTQLFLAGFLGELILKTKGAENYYTIKEKLNY